MGKQEDLVALRSEILKQTSAWFGKKVRIDERLLQVLEYAALCEDGWMDSADVFSATMQHLPSTANLLIRAGVERQNLDRISADLHKLASFNRNSSGQLNLESIFQETFYKDYEPSYHYRRVRKQGSISALDLLTATLESGYETSELTADILQAANLRGGEWNETNSKFIADLVDRIHNLNEIDKSLGDQQFVVYWDGSQYRVGPFGASGLYQLSQEPLKDGSLWMARGNVLQPIQRFSEAAFDQLEYLINGNFKEVEFQRFFEKYPEFLLALGGGKYSGIHPQLILHEDDGGKLIPDFLLEKVNDHFCDICDLKLATQILAKRKRHRPGFRAAIYEAIAQLEFYRNWFDDTQHRRDFYSRTGLQGYRPRVVLVVGRKLDYYSDIQRIQNESILPDHVELITYDDILERAKMYINLLHG